MYLCMIMVLKALLFKMLKQSVGSSVVFDPATDGLLLSNAATNLKLDYSFIRLFVRLVPKT